MIQDIVDYTAIALMWIIVVLGNLVIKKVQPEIAKPYFFYTLLIAVGITAFAFLYKYPLI